MKELQTCFRREDVVRTTTSHLESMKGFLISIAGNKAKPDSLDSCEAAAGLDFGPEDSLEEDIGEEQEHDSYEIIEEKELSQAEREENKAVIEEALNNPRNELSDEPQKELPKQEQNTEMEEEQKKVVVARDGPDGASARDGARDGASAGHSLSVCSPLVYGLTVLAVTRLAMVCEPWCESCLYLLPWCERSLYPQPYHHHT